MEDQTKGLYEKYQVRHADGTPLSPGFVFVLRPDRDTAARRALLVYAVETTNDALHDDLCQWFLEHPEAC